MPSNQYQEDPQELTKFDQTPIVLLRDHPGVHGIVLNYGATMSLVRYTLAGEEYEEWLENRDFVVFENILFTMWDEDEQGEYQE